MKRRSAAPIVAVHVERGGTEPLHRQVYREIVQLILGGRLAPGARVPSSRTLAEDLGVARNTVLLALEQMMSEGFVETRYGSGTFVSSELPDMTPERVRDRAVALRRGPRLAKRARAP